jgi:hypothetical protein
MSEQDPPVEEPPESGSLPPDHDAPGQVDYPDPAFEEEEDEVEAEIETPDADEPEAPEDEDEVDEEEYEEDEE